MSVRRACEGRRPAAPRKAWKREAGTSCLPALIVPQLAYTLCWEPTEPFASETHSDGHATVVWPERSAYFDKTPRKRRPGDAIAGSAKQHACYIISQPSNCVIGAADDGNSPRRARSRRPMIVRCGNPSRATSSACSVSQHGSLSSTTLRYLEPPRARLRRHGFAGWNPRRALPAASSYLAT
jgi:hypothetical protein